MWIPAGYLAIGGQRDEDHMLDGTELQRDVLLEANVGEGAPSDRRKLKQLRVAEVEGFTQGEPG